jgi:MYXO-CTERM domain-containing protein
MTADPVFSFNPDLPEVKREHTASLVMDCGSSHLVTEQGWILNNVSTMSPPPEVSTTPVALRVEVLGEEGQATLVTDNSQAVGTRFTNKADPAAANPAPKTGCSVVDPMSLGLLVLMASLRRRRR